MHAQIATSGYVGTHSYYAMYIHVSSYSCSHIRAVVIYAAYLCIATAIGPPVPNWYIN